MKKKKPTRKTEEEEIDEAELDEDEEEASEHEDKEESYKPQIDLGFGELQEDLDRARREMENAVRTSFNFF